MSDVDHAEEIRSVLEEHGVYVDDIDLQGIRSHGPTWITIDGQLNPGYTDVNHNE